MLQNIVFQDNLYHLSRSIDAAYEGLLLELAPEFFLDKTIDDILFFDVTIQKIYRQIQTAPHLSGYVEILHALHSCQDRYIRLLDFILQGKASMREGFTQLLPKLQGIRNAHAGVKSELAVAIQKSDKSNDSRDIVSRNELSELLNI
jgi:hypothetical protein